MWIVAAQPLAPARADSGGGVPAPFGEYIAVALRHSSDVAALAVPGAGAEFLGRHVRFGEDGAIWLDGRRCETWVVAESDSAVLTLDDPNLSDLAVPPVASDDKRINLAVELVCLDAPERTLGYFVIVDSRVLVAPAPGSTVNVILERPLSAAEIRRLQTQLKSMKFYFGEITGALDAATVRSIGYYAEYRGAAYRFARPAITENLLDGLGVLDATGD